MSLVLLLGVAVLLLGGAGAYYRHVSRGGSRSIWEDRP